MYYRMIKGLKLVEWNGRLFIWALIYVHEFNSYFRARKGKFNERTCYIS